MNPLPPILPAQQPILRQDQDWLRPEHQIGESFRMQFKLILI